MLIEDLEEKFTKYEIARILGARALQIAMDAPLLLKIDEEELERINFNPLEIAKRELSEEVLPITVNRPLPKKREEKIRALSKKEIEELKKKEELEQQEEIEAEKQIEQKTNKEAPKDVIKIKEDEHLEKEEESEEEKIETDSEIMELSMPEDEAEEISEESSEEI